MGLKVKDELNTVRRDQESALDRVRMQALRKEVLDHLYIYVDIPRTISYIGILP